MTKNTASALLQKGKVPRSFNDVFDFDVRTILTSVIVKWKVDLAEDLVTTIASQRQKVQLGNDLIKILPFVIIISNKSFIKQAFNNYK